MAQSYVRVTPKNGNLAVTIFESVGKGLRIKSRVVYDDPTPADFKRGLTAQIETARGKTPSSQEYTDV